MSEIIVKNVEEKDASLIKHLALSCPPLDVHTPYTYWVLCRYFNKSCFVMYDGEAPIGYITAIDIDEGVFIWQIGVIESYRGRGYASLLIDKVYEYAGLKNLDMFVTIDKENKKSYNSFNGFCKKHNLKFEEIGSLSIDDFDDPLFNESEIIYKMSK